MDTNKTRKSPPVSWLIFLELFFWAAAMLALATGYLSADTAGLILLIITLVIIYKLKASVSGYFYAIVIATILAASCIIAVLLLIPRIR